MNARSFVLMASLLVAAGSALAGPVKIQAEKLVVIHKSHQATFTGKVRLMRDDFTLYCDRLIAYYSASDGSIDRAEAFGNVRMQQGEKHGSAQKAVLDERKHTLTLIGQAVIEQPGGRLQGDTIVHDLRGRRTNVHKGKSGRVEMHIDSEKKLQPVPEGKRKP